MKHTFLLFLVLVLFSACNQKPSGENTAKSNDTTVYELKKCYRYYVPLKDTTCVSITYPEITSPKPLKDSLKRILEDGITASEKGTSTIDIYADRFIEDYKKFLAEQKDYNLAWHQKLVVEVKTNTPNHFSIAGINEDFLGGAHGNGYVIYSNFDARTGSVIPLSKIFVNGTSKTLNQIAEPLFRKEMEIADTTSLENAGYFVFDEKEKGKFHINTNFLIRKDGIEFYFNDYEIAPHSVGPSHVFIPYDLLKGILQKDFEL